MAISTFILGESGTGKSASLRNLNADDVMLIKAIEKPLPFKSVTWKPISKDGGNVYTSDNHKRIIEVIRKTRRNIIVLDDFQYIMANEFMRRCSEKGYDKFTDIGFNTWSILNAINELGADKRVYVLSHVDVDQFGNTKAKTIGKMMDQYITLEGQFTIVMRTKVSDGNYKFSTQNNGSDTVKTPMGMFDDNLIDNDLQQIDQTICAYYGI
jgi:hypothetical protein